MDRSKPPPKPCRFFLKPGGCKYDRNCKYSHDLRDARNSPADNPQPLVPQARLDFNDWRYLIPRDNSSAKPLGQELSSFFSRAERLAQADDAGVRQETIVKLASEGGLVRIKELVDKDFENVSESQGHGLFHDIVLPFFRTINNPRIISSIILEDPLATIYNFMYGQHGKRVIALFGLIVRLFLSTIDDDEGAYSIETLETIMTILWKIVDGNGHAIINERLASIADTFIDIVEPYQDSNATITRACLRRIGLRLGVGRALPDINVSMRSKTVRATFEISRDPPGKLSPQGQRHDNDHADIRHIKILPTNEEIRSPRLEYLPPQDVSLLHLGGVEGLLDRHFRLLREDTVGQLRDAIRSELVSDRQPTGRKPSGTRTFTYRNLNVKAVTFSRWKGLEFLVRIDQPEQLRGRSKAARMDWWESCMRLQPDALVCIINDEESVTFCTVLGETSDDSNGAGRGKNNHREALGQDPTHLHISLSIVNVSEDTVQLMLDAIGKSPARGRLVEFPGVILPSFQPTLQALQKMSISNDLPFAEYIAATSVVGLPEKIVPPLYAIRPGFSYSLADIMSGSNEMSFSPQQPFDRERFKANTSLDDAQADALIDCLSRSLALVQGPPGTGKSFTGVALIKVLLAARRKADLGPIVCVCYTNHALDQLLEHLFQHGINQIIRMGSRSKSEVLENCSLRRVAQDVPRTREEKQQLWEVFNSLKCEEVELKSILEDLSNSHHVKVIKDYLASQHFDHYIQMFNVPDDGEWETVQYDKGNEIRSWLSMKRNQSCMENGARRILNLLSADLFSMNAVERHCLYEYWIANIRTSLFEKLIVSLKSHDACKKHQDRIRDEQQLRCLQEANIIGVTTTGLAKQLDLLRKLRSKVLICEEAGEVLEAHILTALLPSLQHVVMIGDHQQLPPHIQNYELSRENHRGQQYSLDLSLFERLVQPPNHQDIGLQFSVLETQRRMHPSISSLIRSTIYPQLKDSQYVELYPEVVGMKKRLFWLDHEILEDGAAGGNLVATSHSNNFEVDMVVALVTHLFRQGTYKENEIAVLTPYLGQLLKIRRVLKTQFEITMSEGDVREIEQQGLEDSGVPIDSQMNPAVAKSNMLKALKVSTIDNFQGEEAKVVVISLVRSNDDKKCGFLRTPNRINVLLSRAQHGMYIIGNSRTSGHVDMWANVIKILQDNDNFGTKLELQCPRHPNTSISVSKPDDFLMFSPEGGCNLHCDQRLHCGHQCIQKCHSDPLHAAVKCLKDCPRSLRGCDHPCTNRCGEPCIIKCTLKVDATVTLPCGHEMTGLQCWQAQDPTKVKCAAPVKRKIKSCGHVVELNCHIDIMDINFKCRAVCGQDLACGHTCQHECHECRQSGIDGLITENHGECRKICERQHNTCSHRCNEICHEDSPCLPCGKPCDVVCGHSKCSKKCHEPCAPCADEHCFSSCLHSKCTMPCAAPCNWLPCSKRCEKALACGHQCPSLCGENCPSSRFCQICANEDVKATLVDFITMSTFEEIDLDKDPCIIPMCGHICATSSMDGQMEMAKHYLMDGISALAIVDPSNSFSMDELKCCATCRGPLRNIARYGRIVRRAFIDECTKRFVKLSRQKTMALTGKLHHQELAWSEADMNLPQVDSKLKHTKIYFKGTRDDQVQQMFKLPGNRYFSMHKLRKEIKRHLKSVQVGEQPFMRVWDLVHAAKRKRQDVDDLELDPSVLLTSEALQVNSLLFRFDMVMLSDFLEVYKELDIELDLADNRHDCQSFIEAAKVARQPLRIVEGHIFICQLYAAEHAHVPVEKIDKLINEARQEIVKAREVCKEYPGSTAMAVKDLEEVESMLKGATFYTKVRDEEFMAVMAAMRQEFSGRGHWYTCANGHPFTIGECGMPMEQARCPQCGAPIGGQHHRAVEGVSHAHDLERRFGGMTI